MISNKLTIYYKESCYVIVSKITLDLFNFNVTNNHNKILKKYVKYLGVYIDNKLTWKNQIYHLCCKLKRLWHGMQAETSCSVSALLNFYS